MLEKVKKHFGWVIVAVLALLPLFIVFSMLLKGTGDKENIEMLYHVTGEFAIRWMVVVLSCTPFYILFGVNNLFVRQAMGIACAVWSIIHFVFFIYIEGLIATFTEVNYIAGFIAVLILIPLLLTSNRKSIKVLKRNWKKLQQLAYPAIILSLLHILLLKKTWLIYAIVVGIGFVLRIPKVKNNIFALRNRKV